MPLFPGAKLGPYEIVAAIGAGGLGEVYRARDTRLGRDVAVKVLPQHLSSNSELKERFDREARAISSLNHARMCTLHDVGHQEDFDFLVMEYFEGESLAERLRKRTATRPCWNVAYADWSPDGKQLVVSKFSASGAQLEYPPGDILSNRSPLVESSKIFARWQADRLSESPHRRPG